MFIFRIWLRWKDFGSLGMIISPAALEQHGIRVLEDKAVRISRGSAHFWLVGISDFWEGPHDLRAAFDRVDDDAPVLAFTLAVLLCYMILAAEFESLHIRGSYNVPLPLVAEHTEDVAQRVEVVGLLLFQPERAAGRRIDQRRDLHHRRRRSYGREELAVSATDLFPS